MPISIRDYQPGDEQKLVDLLDETFSGWLKLDLQCDPLDHWKWKYIDNPLKINVIALATSEDKIIGCIHNVVQKIKIGEGYYISLLGVDVATHEDYRGTGVYSKILSHITEAKRAAGAEFHYAVSSNPILINRNKRYNIAFPSPMQHMLRIRDVDAYLRTVHTSNASLKTYGVHGVKLLNKLTASGTKFSGSDDDFEISKINRFDDDYSRFWDRVKPHYSFIVSRDADYMNWRYLDPRGGRHIVKVAKSGERVLGYIVLRINKYNEGNPVGYIVDLLVQPDHLNVALKLVEDGVAYFDHENVNASQVYTTKKSLYESLLRKTGFISITRQPNLIIYQDSGKEVVDELFRYDDKSIHFFYGDSDHI